MPNEPIWLEPDDIIEFNRLIVAGTGEEFFVRDYGLLDSACFRPRNLFHYEQVEDVVTLAVRLLFGIAANHAFEQGNKRTGFQAADAFLFMNGYDLAVPDTRALGDLVVLVIERQITEADFEDSIRPFIAEIDA